jgi:dihydropteroate synthase
MFTEYKPYSLKLKNKSLELRNPMIMGILNTSEDSFYDGGKYTDMKRVLDRCENMLKDGADLIDIGAQSTRPGADFIPAELEIKRTAPYIEAILKHFPQTLVSIDTFRSSVALAAVNAGAAVVNDVSAGDDDIEMIPTLAELGVPYIIMHKKGLPKTMQDNPQYHDVCTEVINYLDNKIIQCQTAGIKDLIIDPGFGFGKTLEHNYRILKHLELFHNLNCPLLVGISRKSMIWRLLETDPEHALNGSSSIHTIALLKGAHILRVHDVKEARECLKIVSYLRSV